MPEVGALGRPGGADGRSGRVLLLGATGFVGRHVGTALERAGYEVLAVARHPRKTPASWRFHPMDLADAEPRALVELIDEAHPEAVVNAAGEVWSPTADRMRHSNQLLVERLLAALAAAGPRPRLVQLGSVHEYSPQPRGVWLTESSPEVPATGYGRSKLHGTRAVQQAVATGAADAVVLRLSNVIGAGTPRGSLLGQVATQLLEGTAEGRTAEVRVSPLRSSRDFVDAQDVARAVVAALRSPGAVGRVVNVASGASQPVRDMVDLLISISGRPARLVERPVTQSRSPTDTDWMAVEVSAARTVLGWQPRRTPRDMVQDLWRAAAEQRDGSVDR
ncbi:nucleoside-diphosphate-sugar epimerase [Streptomyces achromogenes]|uniref:Nucleoside-diphosphate-sugar epimerase n=1 Tax=Streptomyces achromogenes TaxID=67255 RepID=A0ABU0QBL4_STRAH|nr:NAD(P)-dependent oxidoreductase [Streptomyces achromogenes]MDQ0688019.1 nucleoside-diphosphate-sugar epimerase [Streptomyces achromogenes]MDQ0835214.1 nucleoside-diphosphate-sugar epimerase [Streptomyces achromogenes]